jgi:uncharacterized protein (TIGR03435 family)
LLALPAHGIGQTRPATPSSPVFEVVSMKHVGNIFGPDTVVGDVHHVEFKRPRVDYTGVRLSVEASLYVILQFAYGRVVNPYHCEAPSWMEREVYQIEAIAPTSTTKDVARAMLQTALAGRLGLQCRMVDRERNILTLLRNGGDLKLQPSAEIETNPGFHQVGVFKNKSASLADFAGFLALLTGTEVLEKTGITGRYSFDVDRSQEVTGPWGTNPNIAYEVVKGLGLKLEAGKQIQKTLIVDRANKEPTAN